MNEKEDNNIKENIELSIPGWKRQDNKNREEDEINQARKQAVDLPMDTNQQESQESSKESEVDLAQLAYPFPPPDLPRIYQ